MAMELILKSGSVTIPQAIENLEQLRSELAPKMEYYSSLVVTEEGIKEAKADKAKLNKLKKAIEERRIEVKKQCMAIYTPLEKQCKELVEMIDQPISAIDKQIKSFDEIKKQEKYEELKDFFDKVNGLDFLKFEDVLNPKWGNSTMKADTLKNEICEKVQCLIDDFSEIKRLYENSPMLTAIVQKFEETKDKSHTLAYAALLERQYQAEQERKKNEVPQEQIQTPPQNSIPENVKITEPTERETEPILSGSFKVACTRSQLIALRDFMRSNGINFEVIK